MFEGRRVIVVVPAHNEEKLIGTRAGDDARRSSTA